VKKHIGWRTGGALLTLAGLGASLLTAMDLLLASSAASHDVHKRSLSSLSLELENVSVEIEPGPDGQVRFIRNLKWSMFRPEVQETWEGDTLRIRMRCPAEIVQPCHAAYRLNIPEQTPLSVKADGGDVTARFLTGKVSVDLAEGDVHLDNLPGDLDITGTGGDVWIVDSQAKSAVVKAAAGNVYLGFALPPTIVDARTTAGDLAIRVPRGASYFVDAEAVAGTRDISVEQTAAAPRRIFARNGAGDLTVHHQSGHY